MPTVCGGGGRGAYVCACNQRVCVCVCVQALVSTHTIHEHLCMYVCMGISYGNRYCMCCR